ncbi:sigma-70 family RNA polymerase sigma factor [Catenulispora sp. NL8]|uniref:Sigma-70 family RNA polymerase sigma factor n=1 Tax=Catenulispora pinistramenti TaxID=2705254 RepID=A0ABS5KR28_9ACTN|nr:sigma-70 family RNA polymerase sigma factor [Catenulispora pinistramenti]MBS2548506.1 sigma-70 family RNA polymerase sigma factor [Catenulispora pinistramenti]
MRPDDDSGWMRDRGATRLADVSHAVREDFRKLVEENYDAVVKYVQGLGATITDAQDVTQEAFTDAWQQISEGGTASIYAPRGRLRFVARRKYQQPSARRREVLAMPVPYLPETVRGNDDPSALSALAVSVRRGLEQMGDPLRAILELSMDSLTAREIVAALGRGDQPTQAELQWIQDQLKKARKIMWTYLTDEEGGADELR